MSDNPTRGDNCDRQIGNVNAHETAGEKSFRCDQCGKCFKQRANLQQHKRSHTGEKPYECNYCKKRFGHKGHLNEHKRIHTGDKPFQCDQCCRRFTRASILQQHKRVHTGDKPFKCNQCDTRFNQKSALNQHKRTHHVLENTLLFAQYDNSAESIPNHESMHSSERRSQCYKCGKRFNDAGSIWKLTSISAGGEASNHLNRSECDECFSQTGNLQQCKTMLGGNFSFNCNQELSCNGDQDSNCERPGLTEEPCKYENPACDLLIT